MRKNHPISESIILILGIFILVKIHCESIRNCSNPSITGNGNEDLCRISCNESSHLKFSATFCERTSGNCICDCRDIPKESCTRDPDSDCNIYCERKNPNPDVFAYIGTICEISDEKGRHFDLCNCMCWINPDYVEVNDINASSINF